MASDKGQHQRERTPFWEWVVTGIGIVLVLGSLSFLLYRELTGGESPPDISVQAGAIHNASTTFLVTFRAINKGGSTASKLRIEGRLTLNGKTVETSEALLDYLPAHSERKGGLFFSHDPRRFDIELRPTGYEKP